MISQTQPPNKKCQHLQKEQVLQPTFDLNSLIVDRILLVNPSQKTIFLLGHLASHPTDMAIVIITSCIINPERMSFTQICQILQNDRYYKLSSQCSTKMQIQVIYPATSKHIQKYKKKQLTIMRESAQYYNSIKKQLLERQLSHVDWVDNIINGTHQSERVVFRNEDIIILPDLKCDDIKNKDSLHLLCLFTDKSLYTIRDLTAEHLGLLRRTEESINHVLINLNPDNQMSIHHCRVYFHYPPTFYRLHAHIMYLGLEGTCTVQRCHELATVIGNIQIDGQYYQKVALNTFVKKASQKQEGEKKELVVEDV